jgi:chromosomal replication initiator protein
MLSNNENIISSHDTKQAVNIWDEIVAFLKNDLSALEYKSWLKPIKFIKKENNDLTLYSPSKLIRDYFEKNYLPSIKQKYNFNEIKIVLTKCYIEKQNNVTNFNQPVTNQEKINDNTNLSSLNIQKTISNNNYNFTSHINKNLKFENFKSGPSNEFAVAAAKNFCQQKNNLVSLNPLFIYGKVGLGKTHLLNAIGNEVLKTSPNKKVYYTTAEKFMNDFVRSLKEKNTITFKDNFNDIDILLIDNISFLSGKTGIQNEFLNIFSNLINKGKKIAISSSHAPVDILEINDRLKSRLMSGCVVELDKPSFDLKLKILKDYSENLKYNFELTYDISEEILEFLATKINSNICELEGALKRIISYSILINENLTIETTEKVLKDILKEKTKNISVKCIIDAICNHYNLRMDELNSSSKNKNIVMPRQIGMYLSKELTNFSLELIGKQFGGRDHSTVLYAYNKIKKQIKEDKKLNQTITKIEHSCQGE